MPQFRFVVNGDFVDFYDGTQKVFTVRNTTQDVDWFYTDSPGLRFEVDGYGYKVENANEIEIDGVTLSANTDFDDAIVGIFPNLASGGEGGGINTVGDPVSAFNAKGAVITGSSIALYNANTSGPGMVTTGNQGFAGDKTFNGKIIANDQLQVQDSARFRSQNNSGFFALLSAPALTANRTWIIPDSDGQWGSGGASVIDITYADLLTAISESLLTAGATYKITDRGDRGLFFTAISTSELSITGTRKMLCPANYSVTVDGSGNDWIGVWKATRSVVADQLTIWGGLVWRNLTGAIGTADDDVTLDAVNWEVVTKAGFENDEYIEMQFGVSYDVTNDWIEKQWDGKGNNVGIDFATKTDEGIDYNYCDVTDWNYATSGFLFYNNSATVVSNNSNNNDIHSNRCGGVILNNRNEDSRIRGNIVVLGINNNSNIGSIVDNIVYEISNNSHNGRIQDCLVTNSISDNSHDGHIFFVISNGQISENSGTVDITGVIISGILEFSDNAAAITGGLVAGQHYRTEDALKIVH